MPGPWLRRFRSAAAALFIVGIAAGPGAGPALAEPPYRLDSQISDPANALSPADEAELAAAQAQLQAAQDIQLWVAYVDTFEGMSGQQWTAETASLSGFGGNDLLFAVAVQDRAYGYNVAGSIPVTDAQLQQMMGEVEQSLAKGDWGGAATELATLLANPSSSSGGSSANVLPWILGGAVLVGGVLVLLLVVRNRAGAKPSAHAGRPGVAAPPAALPIAELHKQAAAALIEVDDSIRTSEQELGFAVAQFGEQAAQPFEAALSTSRKEVQEAFQVQQSLERGRAGLDEPAQRGMLEKIIALCRSADERLDAQVDQFDQMRDMERTIDRILPDLDQQVALLEQRLPAAMSTAESLSSAYPQAALAPVVANLEQAVDRIRFARAAVTKGTELVTSADRSGAVAHARAAEGAIGQGKQLIESVERAPKDLADAKAAISALMAETQRDVAEAERLGLSPQLAPFHAHARDTLAWATQVTGAGNYDPVATRRALLESDDALEKALGPARDAAAAVARARALLTSATDGARSSIMAADDFINTRRGGVGAEARTRLSEAKRHFDAGLAAAEQDPQMALQAMQSADQLADRALALAQQDEQRFRDQQMGGPTGGQMGGLGNVILAGILIDAMSGGGRHRGGGMGFPGLGGGHGPGSFGGMGTRGRWGGGGRF